MLPLFPATVWSGLMWNEQHVIECYHEKKTTLWLGFCFELHDTVSKESHITFQYLLFDLLVKNQPVTLLSSRTQWTWFFHVEIMVLHLCSFKGLVCFIRWLDSGVLWKIQVSSSVIIWFKKALPSLHRVKNCKPLNHWTAFFTLNIRTVSNYTSKIWENLLQSKDIIHPWFWWIFSSTFLLKSSVMNKGHPLLASPYTLVCSSLNWLIHFLTITSRNTFTPYLIRLEYGHGKPEDPS